MRKTILIIALLCCITLCFSALAANAPAKAAAASPAPTPQENITVLKQDSGINLSKMNITFVVSPTYASAQVVKFTAPKPSWKLENVLVTATDGWNASSKELPKPLPFTIEIRDSNLRLLYHFEDIQLPYFTSSKGIRTANVEVPAISMNGDFFVCFYGYGSLTLGTELQNATGNSYYYDKRTGQLFSGVLPTRNNQTIPVNWLIRVAGH